MNLYILERTTHTFDAPTSTNYFTKEYYINRIHWTKDLTEALLAVTPKLAKTHLDLLPDGDEKGVIIRTVQLTLGPPYKDPQPTP